MIEIKGKEPKKNFGIDFIQIGDLCRKQSGEFSIVVYARYRQIFVWVQVDSDDNNVRFLVFTVEPSVVSEYLDGKISNAELSISSNSNEHLKYYIVDIDGGMNAAWIRVHNEDIPTQYAELFKETDFYEGSPDEAAIREFLATLS